MRPTHGDLQALRMKYTAAHDAYHSCVAALNKANLAGQKPSQDMLDNEARALRELTDARARFLAAMRAI